MQTSGKGISEIDRVPSLELKLLANGLEKKTIIITLGQNTVICFGSKNDYVLCVMELTLNLIKMSLPWGYSRPDLDGSSIMNTKCSMLASIVH